MRINTNVAALNAYRNLSDTNNAVSSSMQKLSSGFRINRAADDAAGLGIANKMRADTRAMTQASKNAEQANSVLQIAEGSAGTIQKMLERMKELATQAASDNTDLASKGRLDKEFKQLQLEITRTVNTTKFQGKALLDGTGFGTTNVLSVDPTSAFKAGINGVTDITFGETAKAATDWKISQPSAGQIELSSATLGTSQTVAFPSTATAGAKLSFDQLGITIELGQGATADVVADIEANAATGRTMNVAATATASGGSFMVSSSGAYASDDLVTLQSMDLTLATLGVGTDDLLSSANGQTALTNIDAAIGKVSSVLGDIGAAQNRIEYAQQNIKTGIQNFSAAESVIRDLDMAEEMTKFSKNNILAQAGTAMLAQANQSAQGVLQLLRG